MTIYHEYLGLAIKGIYDYLFILESHPFRNKFFIKRCKVVTYSAILLHFHYSLLSKQSARTSCQEQLSVVFPCAQREVDIGFHGQIRQLYR